MITKLRERNEKRQISGAITPSIMTIWVATRIWNEDTEHSMREV